MDKIEQLLLQYKEEMMETLQKWVRIPSVKDEPASGSALGDLMGFVEDVQNVMAASDVLIMRASPNAAMEAIVQLDDVSSCELDTDYNYTDSVRKRCRYQAVFDVVHY